MDKLFFGIERRKLLFFSWKVNIEENPNFKDFKFDSKSKSKQVDMFLTYIKDEHGEELVFSLKYSVSKKDIIIFDMSQVIKLISQEIDKQKVTFFIVNKDNIPKKGQKLDNSFLDLWLKIFICEASTDSLKQMISHMNNFHKKKMEADKLGKENKADQQPANSENKSVNVARSSVNSIQSDYELNKLNRKRKLKALMYGDSKTISQYLSEEKKLKSDNSGIEHKSDNLVVKLNDNK